MQKGKLFFALISIGLLFFCGKFSNSPYPFPEMNFFPKMPTSLANPVTVEGAAIGRFLFYDPILSLDSTISCSSCHNQKSAFSDSPNLFSSGINGQKTVRNAMSLCNLAWSPSYFYDGRARNLEDQIAHPITAKNEMNMEWNILLSKLNSSKFYLKKFKSLYRTSKIDSVQVKNVIAQFLRTLISHESNFDKVLTGKRKFTEDERKGLLLVTNQTRGDCLHCHPSDGNALLTTMKFSNNGLDSIYNADEYKDKGRGAITGNKSDNGKFRIPSLRNIVLTAPYMHDGRFKTLEEVLEFYSTGVHMSANIDTKMGFAYQKGVKLNAEEKKEIIAFLNTLTDSVFISKKEFSNPFVK
ncbi:cytochrome c peroxidase [soil metagenome]